ncbi:MAG TPA: hypothetical protein PKB06_10430, partial [Actinotalea sp.]|nr:hypothetical protein [Actinotalea sp.]
MCGEGAHQDRDGEDRKGAERSDQVAGPVIAEARRTEFDVCEWAEHLRDAWTVLCAEGSSRDDDGSDYLGVKAEVAGLKDRMAEAEAAEKKASADLTAALEVIPNLPAADVP